MGGEQIFNLGWVEVWQRCVGLICAFYFSDFSRVAEDSLAVDDGGDLIERKGVAFYGEGALNGADAVLFAQLRGGVEGLAV